MMPIEWTCKCRSGLKNSDDIETPENWYGDDIEFIQGREYQVDIYPLMYKVYQNGGWNDYVFMNEDMFNRYFEMIK